MLNRRTWLVLTGTATGVFWIVLGLIENVPAGTPGIIDFEFVGDAHRAARFLTEWGAAGRESVRISLIVDYGFMVSYGAFVTLGGLAARDFGRRHSRRALAAAGRVIPWLAVAAALFDALENAFLLVIVGGGGGSALPVISTVCASIKWTLIVIAVAYMAWGTVAWIVHAARGGDRPEAEDGA